MNASDDCIIAQLRHATTPAERERLVSIFMLLCAVGDRIRKLREAREKEQNSPEMLLESEGGNG
jgi:hypothetical protein